MVDTEKIKGIVRERYAEIAIRGESCCGPSTAPADRGNTAEQVAQARAIGYTVEELGELPEGANLGLGCGNPVALASLRKGEVVLDLGSGAGIDCFLAAGRVGEGGTVIGVDMTHEMLAKARDNAARTNSTNVEFRLGEIEALPVADNSVDAIISNCVINLSPDKERVFREAFRVAKPGGRLMVSDMVLLADLSEAIKNSPEAYAACVAGAMMKEDYLNAIRSAGFQDVTVVDETASSADADADCGPSCAGSVVSVSVHAVKPASLL